MRTGHVCYNGVAADGELVSVKGRTGTVNPTPEANKSRDENFQGSLQSGSS